MISIITPCFNHGLYLDELIDSIWNYQWPVAFEHIIVNDGSTDEYTLKKLSEIESQKRITVVHQKNQGPSAARNSALQIARGEYILPVDGDNILIPDVFSKALRIMEQHSNIAVVHTNYIKFGEVQQLVEVPDADLGKLLYHNYIDTCALIRKDVFIDLGGYDTLMPHIGNEDWELWIRLLSEKKKFYHLNETGFLYRVLNNSVSRTNKQLKFDENKLYIFNKYQAEVIRFFDIFFKDSMELYAIKNYVRGNKLKSIMRLMANRFDAILKK